MTECNTSVTVNTDFLRRQTFIKCIKIILTAIKHFICFQIHLLHSILHKHYRCIFYLLQSITITSGIYIVLKSNITRLFANMCFLFCMPLFSSFIFFSILEARIFNSSQPSFIIPLFFFSIIHP